MKIVHVGSIYMIADIIDELPRNKNWPWNWRRSSRYFEVQHRSISKCYFHQKAGGYAPGIEGVKRTAKFLVADPPRGKGYPGYSYTIDIPHKPDTKDGKLVIYQCQPPGMISWHSSDNEDSISVGLQGYFKSRHCPRFVPFKGTSGEPSAAQMEIVEDLCETYIKPLFYLEDCSLLGHFESPRPKPCCPGDTISNWLKRKRKEALFLLDTWEERQAALVALGSDLGSFGPKKNGVDGKPGEKTRLAIEDMEKAFGLTPNGTWDSKVHSVVTRCLVKFGVTQEDIDRLT